MIDPASFSAQLVAATRASFDKNNAAQSSSAKEKIRTFKALDGKVRDLSNALKDLGKSSKLRATETKLSKENIVKATTTDGAIVGSYDIEISELAQAHRIGLSFSDDKWKAPHDGTLTFKVGPNPDPDKKTKSMALDLSKLPKNANLMDLRNAINNASDNPGVQATIIRTGSDVKLVISSEETGTDHQVGIQLTGGTSSEYKELETALTGKMELSKAKNAALKFNGLDITSQSNKIENIADHLTLELTKTNVGEPLTLTVERDDDAIHDSLESLVNAYNGLIGRVKTATIAKIESGDTKPKTRAPLLGDSTAPSMVRQLRNVFSHLPKGTYLSQMGLKFDKNGEMSLDKEALAKSLDKDPNVLNNMLLGNVGKDGKEVKGIVERLSTTLKPYSKSDGIYDQRVSSLNSELDRLKDKTAQMDRQMDNLYQRYLKQFTAMQQLQSQMQQTSAMFGGSAQI